MGIPGQLNGAIGVEIEPAPAPVGESEEFVRMFAEAHAAIHRRAQGMMRRERPDHTLQATALVDEAYLRLAGSGDLVWDDLRHFVGIFARVMRQILVDHARSRGSLKRGGRRRKLPLDAVDMGLDADRAIDHEAVNEALLALERVDPEQAHVLELRFYGGFTGDMIAQLVGRSPRTIDNWMRIGCNWLHDRLK